MTGTFAERLSTMWLPTGGPKTLAAFRVASGCAGLWYAIGLWGFRLPPFELAPAGTAWLDFLPTDQSLFRGAVVVLMVAALLVIVGYRPGITAWLAASAAFYVGFATTLTGKVDHAHHVIWALVIVALSPSANAWSIRRETRAGSTRWPLAAIMLLLGLIYFGAGLQKLGSDFTWGWSDNLKNIMLNMAWEKNQEPIALLIDYPLIGRIMGLSALVFELSFLPLLIVPRSRRWVWPIGLLFHWGTWLVLGIPFLTLQMLYVVFIPFDKVKDRDRPTFWQSRVIVVLLCWVTVFSLAGIERAWPVAAYPGFDGKSDHQTNDVEVVVDGESMFVTDMSVSADLGRQRILWFVQTAILRGRVDELAEWLHADSLSLVTIDTLTGRVMRRETLR
jgi:hypothetical protein